MRIGIVRTVGSPCRCAEAAAEGLVLLGHEPLLFDSEEIACKAASIARSCDFVLDHTDTFLGSGLLRGVVRSLLESQGARIVGSPASACFLADDKAAAKTRLIARGIPVPPGIVLVRPGEPFPSWLRPPLVLKPSFEHMSRGVSVAKTRAEAHRLAAKLFRKWRQPVLVEVFIPGRDLAVSVLEGQNGLEVLPPVEWPKEEGGNAVLSEAFKLNGPRPGCSSVLPAHLPPGVRSEIEAYARSAFAVLGLRDYARFDLRLTEGGAPFFLEANTTPSLETEEAFALAAQESGIDYPVLMGKLLSAAEKRYEGGGGDGFMKIALPTGPIVLEVPRGVHVPPPSSIELAGLLDVAPGERVLELGCGSGLLSVAAARLGAKKVTATDMDAKSLNATAANALRNEVQSRIEVCAGFWFDALRKTERPERFDVIIATPPQTPGLQPFGPKYGGPDGAAHLLRLAAEAPRFLTKKSGRLWLLAISLSNADAVLRTLEASFADVAVVRRTERFFQPDEYDACDPGLFEYLKSLRDAGYARFEEVRKGTYRFHNLFIRAGGAKFS